MATEKSILAVIRAARPFFRNDHDKIAFALHASFLASGYVLTATGPPALAETALSNPSTDEVGSDHWNDLDDEYGFVYVNPEKGSKKYLVKCLVMKDWLFVDGLEDGASEPVHLEINIGDYVGDSGSSNYSAQFKNLDKLLKNLKANVLSKFDYRPDASSSRNPLPSSAESERSSRILNEPHVETGIVYPPIYQPGGSDLFPGPGAGMYPPRGGYGAGGGNVIGPNDPIFGRGGRHPGFTDPSFPRGLPGVPPGARFDPFGPPGVPGFEPNRFASRPDGRNHPDLEPFRDGSDFI